VAGDSDTNGRLVRFGWWLLAMAVCVLVVAIRIRLLRIPLERDEGEYAYAGQLMLQGIPPYKLAYNMKFPGTYAAYALIMSMFGQTIFGIHIGFLLVNAATVALVFLLGRRLIDETAGLVAAAAYALLSLSPSVLGFAAHAAHFVMLPVLGATLLLLNGRYHASLARPFASGLLFGLAVVMKQPGIFFIMFAAIYFVAKELRSDHSRAHRVVRTLIFGAGVILPCAIVGLLLIGAGVFKQFWFWTVNYAAQYGSLVPLAQAPRILLHNTSEVIGANWPLWILAGVGAVAGVWNSRTRAGTFFLLGFLLFSALALCPGFYFRHHYFIFVLPALALLAGTAISALGGIFVSRTIMASFAPIVVIAAALAFPIVRYKNFFFEMSPVQASRIIYPESPFSESVRIAEYIREHTTPDDKIAVLGSEPEIYFYSQRHSATGYIYTYPLMEPQKYARRMQEEMIREIEQADPKYVVSVAMNDSWLHRPGSDQLIFTWANDYIGHNYVPAGFVNITSAETEYYFGDVPPTVATLKDYILIYRRNQ
jgi:hypothetical protein